MGLISLNPKPHVLPIYLKHILGKGLNYGNVTWIWIGFNMVIAIWNVSWKTEP